MEGDLSVCEAVNARQHIKIFNTYAATKKKQTQRSYFMPLTLHRMAQLISKFIPPDTDVFVLVLRRYPDL